MKNTLADFLFVPNIKQVVFPFLFSLLFFLCMLVFNVSMQIIVQQSVMSRNHHLQPSTLYDPIHEITQDFSKHRDIIEYFVKFVCSVTVISLITQKVRKSINIFKRLLLIHGSFYFLRGITMVTFQIGSSPDPMCPKNELESGFSAFIRHLFLTLTRRIETCFDLFFSGHTGTLTLFTLCWFYYSSEKVHEKVRVYVKFIFALVSLCGMVLVVICRMHYTLDVLFGFGITCVLFFGYHDIIWHVKQRVIKENLTSMKKAYESLKTERFLKKWIFLFFIWLEYLYLKISFNKTIDDIV